MFFDEHASCRFHGVHCNTGALGIFSCLKSPTPGTTILLSSGAWSISYLESRSESFCLLQGSARKSFQLCGSDTFLSYYLPGIDYLPGIGQAFIDWFLRVLFFIESSIYCCIDSSQCLAQLTPARVGIARSVHVHWGHQHMS